MHYVPKRSTPGENNILSALRSEAVSIFSPVKVLRVNILSASPAVYDQPGYNPEMKWPTVGEFDHCSYCSPIMFIRKCWAIC